MKYFFLAFFIFLLNSCTTKESKISANTLNDFLEKNRYINQDILNLKLDSILSNSQTIENDQKALIYFEKGKIYSYKYKDKDALNNFEQALSLLNETQNITLKTKTLINLSTTNCYLKNTTEATSQALKAYDLAKVNKLPKYMASANSALSTIYYYNKDYENSFKFLKASLKIQQKEKDSTGLASNYNNIAILHRNINNLDSAVYYNNEALTINLLLKDSIGIGKSYNNIGVVYSTKGDVKNALLFFNKAIENNNTYKIKNSKPFDGIGDLYIMQNKIESAKGYYKKAVAIEEEKNKLENALQPLEALSTIAKKENDIINEAFYELKIAQIKNKNEIKEIQEKAKVVAQQQKWMQAQKEVEHIKQLNTKNRIIFISVFAILGLITAMFFQRNKNQRLRFKDEKSSLELKVLRSQMNPHFIFNALSAIQNSILDNNQIKSATYLSKFAKLIRQNFDFINKKTISLKDELDALINYLDTQKLRFVDKFDYTINIDENINTSLINIPPLLLQPFIENAIEHGFKNIKHKGQITLNVSENENQVTYQIADNGNGFDQKTNNLNSKDHAIDIFKKRINLLENKEKNNFNITSNDNGTIINFKLSK